MFRIGDFSNLSQVSIKTLRYYDEIGLLKPSYVDNTTGYRYYSAELLPRLNRILVFKELGFSLTEIRDLMWGELPPDKARDILQIKREELKQKVEMEQSRLAQVETWLAQIERDGRIPAYEVALKEFAPQLVASVRDRLSEYRDIDHLFDELNDHLKQEDTRGRYGAIWHSCEQDGSIDCEAIVFLRNSAPESRRIKVYQLPANRMACLIHRGSDETSCQAYAFARSWLKSNGYSATGPNYELYRQAVAEGDESSNVTEIQFPIQSG